MYRRFLEEVSTARLPSGRPNEAPVSDADVRGLPRAAERYLRFMGVVDRPRDWSFRARFVGRFRRQPGDRWMPCEAWQYNSGLEVARIFHMRVRMVGVLPMMGRDTYLRGQGRMHGKLMGLVTVVDGQGPEFDVGELVTYLNDAILVAPSFLLRLDASWSTVDDQSFDVTLSDAGRSVTARVFLDERGAARDFRTSDRYAAFSSGLVQARWSTPIEGWQVHDGRPIPSAGSAIWDLPEGPFPYVEGRWIPGSVAYNIPPGA